jgi:hypothetical protein
VVALPGCQLDAIKRNGRLYGTAVQRFYLVQMDPLIVYYCVALEKVLDRGDVM